MITAEQIAAGLQKSKRVGDGWICCCPAHDDKKPSLSVNDGDDKPLVKCHAGCEQDAVISELKAMGLWEVKPKRVRSRRKQVASYDYCDENGALLYQVLRYEPKDFRQRAPDPANSNGKQAWKWSLTGVRRVLYHLPEVMAATRGVFIVEGEKDVESLRALGVTATTCCGGTDSWRNEYNYFLVGKRVIICPDNDEPGRKHAAKIASSLCGKAAEIRMLNLPGLGPKQDITDWIKAGGTRAQLADLVRAAEPLGQKPTEPEREPTEPEPEPKKPDWRDQLLVKVDRDGNEELLPRVHNAILLLDNHPDTTDKIYYNAFTMEVEVEGAPWSESETRATLTDVDDTRATAWLECHGCMLSMGNVHSAIVSVGHRHPYDPLKEYLNGLQWDGVDRIEQGLSTIVGAPGNPYTSAVSRRFFIGAVARALRPGCKLDTMLILEGPQGGLKSTAVRHLFGSDWYTDELADLGSKDSAMQLQGVWGVEVAELSTMHRAETNRLKEWLTRRVDRFRPPYGRNLVEAPRRCVLVGTVNPGSGYLRDETGARRFWPVDCGRIDLEILEQWRDQLWAEAVHRLNAGEKWWFEPGDQVLRAVEDEQQDRYETDPWDESISDIVSARDHITTAEVMDALEIEVGRRDRRMEIRIGKTLVSMGWYRRRKRVGGIRCYVYERILRMPGA